MDLNRKLRWALILSLPISLLITALPSEPKDPEAINPVSGFGAVVLLATLAAIVWTIFTSLKYWWKYRRPEVRFLKGIKDLDERQQKQLSQIALLEGKAHFSPPLISQFLAESSNYLRNRHRLDGELGGVKFLRHSQSEVSVLIIFEPDNHYHSPKEFLEADLKWDSQWEFAKVEPGDSYLQSASPETAIKELYARGAIDHHRLEYELERHLDR